MSRTVSSGINLGLFGGTKDQKEYAKWIQDNRKPNESFMSAKIRLKGKYNKNNKCYGEDCFTEQPDNLQLIQENNLKLRQENDQLIEIIKNWENYSILLENRLKEYEDTLGSLENTIYE